MRQEEREKEKRKERKKERAAREDGNNSSSVLTDARLRRANKGANKVI